ncbi:MAG: tRNA guanosine(34) transglycosylase Tgt [Chloroflexi bacterium]|nr:tRNA guanosine(34) transglycosylase Tgt [Chloroflexota bacterium]MCL5110915.1 tRNA guanosine(34) transglycosylase Tgt [Chloroflexota bacterium]
MSLEFTLEGRFPVGEARAGSLRTPHGVALTPLFMPVGTQATVKSLGPDDVASLGATFILANTYHLYLRPGAELVAEMGGLHRFMAWPRPILTDSGGFQVFSLGHMRQVGADGVRFRSHVDGSEHYFTPERATAVQELLGADVAMAFDECTPYPCSEAYAREALGRTHRWAERCLAAHTRVDQALFGIVQGSTYPALRHESARFLSGLGFAGYAIGGLSVGEPKGQMYELLAETVLLLPAAKPRYLMGVGSPEDIVEGVAHGVDMFDCVLPTRVARNGGLYTWHGRINVRNAAHKHANSPVEGDCDCYTCRTFSLAYLHHLFRCEELLAYRLATIHNLRFLQRLTARIRAAILEGSFSHFRAEFLAGYRSASEEVRAEQRAKWSKRVVGVE